MRLLTLMVCSIILHLAIIMDAKDQKTIIAFGDSTTAKRGHLEIYSNILTKELEKAGILAKVINAGVPGNTTMAARKRFEKDVLRKNPDLVIIQFGINDAAVDVWKNATKSRVSLDDYMNNLRYFIKTLRKNKTKIILMTPNALAWTPKLKKLYGKPPYTPRSAKGFNVTMRPYVKAVRKIAKEEKVVLVDIFAYFDSQKEEGLNKLLLDGMHPNKKGHRIVADKLLIAIPKLLVD